jgi:tetrahydromethanopterin S-methyltransferase subunit G
MTNNDTPGDVPKSGRVSAWLSEIDKAYNGEGMSKYDERCRVIRKRYRYEGSAFVRTRKYQLLWSNIETMKSAVYSQPPKAVVSRRYRDGDPVGRVACEILERAINFSFDASNFDGVFKQVRDDFLLYARGCARIYYEPEYEDEDDLNEDIEDATDIQSGNRGQDGSDNIEHPGTVAKEDVSTKSDISTGSSEGEKPEQQLAFENVRIRFVQRSDFRHQPARTWEEVQWVAFRAFMTRAEVTKRFGKEIGEAIGLDSDPVEVDDNERPSSNPGSREGAKATVWEIWDKAKNRVLWIAKNWPDVLEEGPPYLDLDGFYPCPRPAYGTVTPDSLVPVPDYVLYQDQCEEIDQLTARIGALSDALKFVGFYPGGPHGEGAPEIEKAFAPGVENKMIAVQNWSQFAGQSGPPVVFAPVDHVIKIIEGCVKLRQQLVEDVYQIVGIPDIMRGATDPQETEGAQQLKSQHAGNRIRDRQQEIARFCRDIGRLCGQVIAAYCSPATIMKMTNMKLPTQQDVMLAQLQTQRAQQIQQLATMRTQAQGPGLAQTSRPAMPQFVGAGQ